MAKKHSNYYSTIIATLIVILLFVILYYVSYSHENLQPTSYSTTRLYKTTSTISTSSSSTTLQITATSLPTTIPTTINYGPLTYNTSGTYSYNDGEVSLNSSYSYYLCGAASSTSNHTGGIDKVPWNQTNNSDNFSSIGTSVNDSCAVYTKGYETGVALIELGVKATSSKLIFSSNNPNPSTSFYLGQRSSLLAIYVGGTYYLKLPAHCISHSCPAPTINYPASGNCYVRSQQEDFADNIRSPIITLFICSPAEPGFYQINQSMIQNASVVAYAFDH